MAVQKKPKTPEPPGESAPMWIVSFADLVTLMMSFFVVLYALKQGGEQQQMEATAAIKVAFGYDPAEESNDPIDYYARQILGRRQPPMSKNAGRSDLEARGVDGHNADVETIRSGKDITTGGKITFAPGEANLDDNGKLTIRKIADLVRGHNNVIMIKGHISADELSLRPDDANGMNLSERRANVVLEELVKLGIKRSIMRPVACGPFEPVKTGVYDPQDLRFNRRVEIFTTDQTDSEYFPTNTVPVSTTDNHTESPASSPNEPNR